MSTHRRLTHTDNTSCLAAVMHAVAQEIYLFDRITLRFVDVNLAACSNLQYTLAQLLTQTPLTLAPWLAPQQLAGLLASLDFDPRFEAHLQTRLRRADGSTYALDLRLLPAQRDNAALIVAIGAPEANDAECQSRARLAELTAHIETVKEQERARIGREIHDDLGGNLTAIKMALAMLCRRLPQDDVLLQEKAAYLDALVDRSIESAHRIALDLRPLMLDFGIVAAFELHIRQFEKQAGVACLFTPDGSAIEPDLEHATALFRIFQECLTNIAKHAQASRVEVRLRRTRRQVHLTVADNGCGMAPADRAKPKSFGIRGMVERAHALGGSVTLRSAKGGGTVVAIDLPLAAETAPA